MPKVTVLLAVFNGEPYLAQSIDSILAQTYTDFEFLIVNDGSTDRSRDIVLSYRDPRIRLLENERNLGLPASLNRGLAAARGELVARQDADDISEPDRLERQVRFLDANPRVALAGAWYREIDDRGRLLGEHELPCDHTSICWALLFFCPFVHSAVMLRRAVVLSPIGGYDESLPYAEDHELWVRIADSLAVANIPEHLVRWRTHGASKTATCGERVLEGDRLRLERVARLLAWTERAFPNGEATFRTMDALYRGAAAECDAGRTLPAVAELLRLQHVFARNNRLDAAANAAHRAAVLRRTGWTLATLARTARAQRKMPRSVQLALRSLALRVRAKWLDLGGRHAAPAAVLKRRPTTL